MTFYNHTVGKDIYFELINDQNNRISFWHNSFSLLFVIRGEASLFMQKTNFSLKKEDILTIDRFIPYTLTLTEGALVLRMHINLSLLRFHHNILSGCTIHCCSLDEAVPQEKYNRIRGFFAEIFTLIYKEQKDAKIYIYHRIFDLLQYLFIHFSSTTQDSPHNQNDIIRLSRILQYIEGHYMQPLTVKEVADSEYLSVGYFSRFFKKYTGYAFIQYLKMVRLGYAYVELCNTNQSITEIALNFGFPNSNALITAFKETYGITPREYRKALRPTLNQEQAADRQFTEYPVNDAFASLAKYLHMPALEKAESTAKQPAILTEKHISCQKKTKYYPKTWKNLLTVGWAKEILLAPVQEQIRRCQEEIGFRYIRFHGLLDDDMIVYREDKHGHPIYNFTYIDMLFDFILSVGLKPYVEFSYMPSVLARDDRVFFEHASVVSMPKDLGRWEELIETLVKHWVSRYGNDEVAQWMFVVLNGYLAFLGHFTMEEYAGLYQRTYRTVKRLVQKASFGGPGCDIGMLSLKSNHDWEIFFDYCRQNACEPDFISVQCFHSEFKEDASIISEASMTHETAPVALSGNENYLSDALRYLQGWLRKRGIRRAKIMLETWNSTMWQRDLRNDTCFKAAFLAKNILQNTDKLEGMGYWTLSDFMEELPVDRALFHGGYGLFTYNGIPKSGYNALHILNRLGEELVERGGDYVVTKKNGKYRIAAYHYCHYDKLYLSSYTASKNEQDRYSVFVEKSDLLIRFYLENMEEGKYELEYYTVHRDEGSSFDLWMRMGSPQHLRPSRQLYLRNKSVPSYSIQQKSTKDGSLVVEAALKPHQIVVVSISRL